MKTVEMLIVLKNSVASLHSYYIKNTAQKKQYRMRYFLLILYCLLDTALDTNTEDMD